MRFVRLTKTDGARQQPIFVSRDRVAWVQGAPPPALPTPEESEASGSGTILHFAGGSPQHTVTVTEPLEEVIRMLEGEG